MKHDQVFTPDFIVKKMLDDIGYSGTNLEKTILEPSFGDGAFLVEIVRRIAEYAEDEQHLHTLLDRVYGFEIDEKLYHKTLSRLNTVLAEYGYSHDWHYLRCMNALDMPIKTFDYIVGNPPYVRIHDLDAGTRALISKRCRWGQGMTDLYVIFFELCIQCMGPDSELIFIAPNSWMRNTSQKRMRQYLSSEQLVHKITNYHCLPVFGNILTYPAITHLKRGPDWEYVHMGTLHDAAWRRVMSHTDNFKQIISEDAAQFLETLTGETLGDLCTIQNGVATNLDSVYIKPWSPRGEYLRPAIKASTLCQDYAIIFPYEWDGTGYTPLSEEAFKEKEPNLYYALFFNKDRLLQRNMESRIQWFQYARSQGIQSSRHRKFVLKHILHGEQEYAEFVEVGPETIVYSGMYIVVNDERNIERVRAALSSADFCKYLLLMGKDMAGGYKTVSTKIVKSFPIGTMEEMNEK